jgi:hypothetical protein
MDFDHQEGWGIGPDLIRRACGGWLAVSPEGAILRIGVTAATEAEARDLFHQTAERWRQLLADPQNT